MHIRAQPAGNVRVEIVPRAGCLAHSAVARDGRRSDGGAGRPQVGAAGDEGHLGARARRDSVSVCQPGQQQDERAAGGLCRLGGVVVADDTNQLGETLVAAGGVAGHRSRDASLTALPNPSFRVDDEVVGDVVPTFVGARVIVEPAAQDSRDIGTGVPVAGGGVMNDQELDVLRIERPLRWMSRAPARSGVDCESSGWERQARAEQGGPGGCSQELAAGDQAHRRKP